MKSKALLGIGKRVVPFPDWAFRAFFFPAMKLMKLVFSLMFSEDHYKVRKYLVTELIRLRKPISPEHVSKGLGLPLVRVEEILKRITARQVWGVRDAQGNVTWAYPITVEKTGFKLTFDTGEQVFGP